jgi:hypothetical protein
MISSVFCDINAVLSVESQPTFGESCRPIFKPDDRGDMFLRNSDELSTDYMALYHRRQNSSCWSGHTLQPPEMFFDNLASPSLRLRNKFHTDIEQFVKLYLDYILVFISFSSHVTNSVSNWRILSNPFSRNTTLVLYDKQPRILRSILILSSYIHLQSSQYLTQWAYVNNL